MPAERDLLDSLVASIDPRGDVDAARRRGGKIRRRRRLLTSVGACLLVLALIGAAALAADHVTDDSQTHIVDTPPDDPETGSSVDPWEPLPPPPVPIDRGTAVIALREGVAFVWGSRAGRAGAIFQRVNGQESWTETAAAPTELGSGPATAIETDGAIVVIAGETTDVARAAIYDPTSDSGRVTAQPPFTVSDAMTVGWTGSEVVAYGVGGGDCVAEHPGYAYNPATDAWRQLPDPPFGVRAGAAAAWASGRLVVVGGSQQRCSNEPVDPRRDGAMYDPRTDSWAPIAEHPTADPSWAQTVGERVFVFDKRCLDDCSSAASFHPLTGEWRDLGTHGPPILRWLTTHLQGRFVGGNATGGHSLDADGTWRDLPDLPDAFSSPDPLAVHLVGGTGGRILVVGPQQFWRFPGDPYIAASMVPVDAIGQLMTHARFPQGVSLDQVPLAPEVSFAFRSTVVGTRSHGELGDEQRWRFEYPNGTLEGSFSVLEILRGEQQRWVGGGAGGRCSSAPPTGAEALRQAGVHGDVDEPCEHWWSVDVYVDRDGLIRFIRYDRGGS